VSDRVTARMEMKKVCKDLSNSGGYGEKAKVPKSRSVPLNIATVE